MNSDNFKYTDERFADIMMLRYRLENFDSLSLRQKETRILFVTSCFIRP